MKKIIEVSHRPSFPPESNPDEYLNCDLKAGLKASSPARSEEELQGKILGHLRMLQRRPERVAKSFDYPAIRCAA